MSEINEFSQESERLEKLETLKNQWNEICERRDADPENKWQYEDEIDKIAPEVYALQNDKERLSEIERVLPTHQEVVEMFGEGYQVTIETIMDDAWSFVPSGDTISQHLREEIEKIKVDNPWITIQEEE